VTTEEKLRIMLATYPVGQYQIDTLEITHSLFSERFLFTREPGGITATLTNLNGSTEEVDYTGINFEPVLNRRKADLDSNFAFTLADPENQLDDELASIPFDDSEDILVTYRAYFSDDLTSEAEIHRLKVLKVNQEKGIFTIECGVPQLNWRKTGIIYDYDTFKPLRAF